MNKIMIYPFVLLILAGMVFAGTVTRSFSSDSISPGGTIQVTISIIPSEGDNKLVLTEDYPDSFTVSNTGGLSTTESGKLKKVLMDLEIFSTRSGYTYALTAPSQPGTYSFSGTYILTGNTAIPISGKTSLIVSSCGNGRLDSGEDCDGNQFDELNTCISLGYGSGALICASDCTFDLSQCSQCVASCANKNCGDDGCGGSCGSCSSGQTCSNGMCIFIPSCGNNRLDKGEQCDGGVEEGDTCLSEGFDTGNLQCAKDCTFDTSGCISGPICGNTIKEAGENCLSCPEDVNCVSGETCNNEGTCVSTSNCGNGVKEMGETCSGCPADVSCAADEFCNTNTAICEPTGCNTNCESPYTCTNGVCQYTFNELNECEHGVLKYLNNNSSTSDLVNAFKTCLSLTTGDNSLSIYNDYLFLNTILGVLRTTNFNNLQKVSAIAYHLSQRS